MAKGTNCHTNVNTSPPVSNRATYSLPYVRIVLIMVAIPSWLLASSVTRLNIFARSAAPHAEALGWLPGYLPTGFLASITGPVISSNFPDPAIIHVDGISYAFATRDRNKPAQGRAHVQVATSKDNTTWTVEDTDALPNLASWQTGNAVWAPDVVKLDNGKFVLYYADGSKIAPNKHCVGAAVSTSVNGPYVPDDDFLICPDPKTQGGAIDPEGFFDHSTGKRYVIYKVDGNSIGHGGLCMNSVKPIVPTPLMLQELSADDGVTLIGDPVELIRQDQHNGPLIEAPAMHRSDEGIYFLFYSSNCFTTPGYDVEYATATDIRGPWEKKDDRLLHSGDGPGLIGPGGLDIIADGTMVVFHGILGMKNSKEYGAQVKATAKKAGLSVDQQAKKMPLYRGMYTAKATFSGRTVTLN